MDKGLYRDWEIYPTNFTAHPNWRKQAFHFTHKDYDGEGDSRIGFAPTVEECKRKIDAYWDEDIRDV